MKSQLVLLKTHVISKFIYEEYYKLTKTPGIEPIIYLDNETTGFFPRKNNIVEKKTIETPVKLDCYYLITDLKMLKKNGLPLYSDLKKEKNSAITWYNSDYPLYIAQKYLPGYDYYWSLEYDVYSNGKDYSAFFNKYKDVESDLLTLSYAKAEEDWIFHKNTEWAYSDVERYCSIFPIIRMNNKAIDMLRERRIERGKQYEALKTKLPKNKWLFCELFVPTEATLLGLSIECMNEPLVRTSPNYSYFELPHLDRQGQIIHPVKNRKAITGKEIIENMKKFQNKALSKNKSKKPNKKTQKD